MKTEFQFAQRLYILYTLTMSNIDEIKQQAKKIEEIGEHFKLGLADFKKKQRETISRFREELKQRKINEIKKSMDL